MIKKLRLKFVLVNMSIVTIMLAVIFGLVLYFTKTNMEKESIRMMQSVPIMPVQPVPPGHPQDFPGEINPSLFMIFKTPDGVLKAEGSNIYDLSDEALITELFETTVNSEEKTGVIDEYDLRYCILKDPVMERIVFADISGERTIIRHLIQTCAFIAAVSYAAFFVISLLLAWWTVKPVESTWNQQKQFVADASHELKTPLTVIMTNAEMLQDNTYTDEKRTQFSGSILTMARQMRGLTESLLELARSDNHSVKINTEHLDLSQLVGDALLPFEPLYFEAGLELKSEIEDKIYVNGDPVRFSRLTDILLDNAMKYSYPQTEVFLRLKRHNNYCILSVQSHGNTIFKDDLKNIFKRFYRIDKVRSMNHSYGLGLSIAESIVIQAGGKIWAESKDDINIFYVKLPYKQYY